MEKFNLTDKITNILKVDSESDTNKMLCKYFRTEHHYYYNERVSYDEEEQSYYRYIDEKRITLPSCRCKTITVVTAWSIVSKIVSTLLVLLGGVVGIWETVLHFDAICDFLKWCIVSIYYCVVFFYRWILSTPSVLIVSWNTIIANPILTGIFLVLIVFIGVLLLVVAYVYMDDIEITECRLSKDTSEQTGDDQHANP